MSQQRPSTFINSDDSWVFTDISHYADHNDINEYMQSIFPVTYDKRRNRNVQNYKIEACVSK